MIAQFKHRKLVAIWSSVALLLSLFMWGWFQSQMTHIPHDERHQITRAREVISPPQPRGLLSSASSVKKTGLVPTFCEGLSNDEANYLDQKYRSSPRHRAAIIRISEESDPRKFSALLNEFPNDPDVMEMYLRTRGREPEKAAEHLEVSKRFAKLFPDRFSAHLGLAKRLFETGDLVGMREALAQVRHGSGSALCSSRGLQVAVDLLTEVGRDRTSATARCLFKSAGSEAVDLGKVLGNESPVWKGPDSILDETFFQSGLYLISQILADPNLPLTVYTTTRPLELLMLTEAEKRGIKIATENGIDVSSLAKAAAAEYDDGVYFTTHAAERILGGLSLDERTRLISSVEQVGTISAFNALRPIHPELFVEPITPNK